MTETKEHAAVELVRKLRFDLTAMQGKVSELLRQLGELELPEPPGTVCDVCGYRPSWGMPLLAEHVHTAHGGPLPAHWADFTDGSVVSEQAARRG